MEKFKEKLIRLNNAIHTSMKNHTLLQKRRKKNNMENEKLKLILDEANNVQTEHAEILGDLSH